MQLKGLIEDDDAVSPVIGVILMVAITVILAAVIASFVLGLGQNATNQTPTASFTFDYDRVDENVADQNHWGVVKITHDGGDSIVVRELFLRGEGYNTTGQISDMTDSPPGHAGSIEDYVRTEDGTQLHHVDSGSWNESQASGDDDSQVVSGDFVNVYVREDYDISVNYEAEEGQASSTLQSDSGPAN